MACWTVPTPERWCCRSGRPSGADQRWTPDANSTALNAGAAAGRLVCLASANKTLKEGGLIGRTRSAVSTGL